jgi:hypothetical protein
MLWRHNDSAEDRRRYRVQQSTIRRSAAIKDAAQDAYVVMFREQRERYRGYKHYELPAC